MSPLDSLKKAWRTPKGKAVIVGSSATGAVGLGLYSRKKAKAKGTSSAPATSQAPPLSSVPGSIGMADLTGALSPAYGQVATGGTAASGSTIPSTNDTSTFLGSYAADKSIVDSWYTGVLGRPADSTGETFWINRLLGGGGEQQTGTQFYAEAQKEIAQRGGGIGQPTTAAANAVPASALATNR